VGPQLREPRQDLLNVHLAQDEALIHEHARQAAFPMDRMSEVLADIDPTTDE
jgi:hypothetical protein